jgi:TolA-binding protein
VTQGDREEALREAMDVTAANPHSPYAVRLLILGAECLSFLGRKDQACALLQTAVDDYPEDPDQDHAREILQTLGGQAKPEAKEPAAEKPPAEKPAARPRPAG